MKILLDTHILIWFFNGDERLSLKARELIADESNEIYYSLLSVWEIEIKHKAHPDRLSMTGERFGEHCKRLGFIQVPVEVEHILKVKNLVRKENTPQHRDPFDRLMICQAIVDNMIFIQKRREKYESPLDSINVKRYTRECG
ncbi:MAG: type II toxin-antitoxin system VapC family toxin [Selenomonadaceae bacterium]|nr:type II toxin-antitoxin system VapC family toxin [Selenomonadaceae bacterium]